MPRVPSPRPRVVRPGPAAERPYRSRASDEYCLPGLPQPGLALARSLVRWTAIRSASVKPDTTALLALIVSVVALGASIVALVYTRRSAVAAERQALAAEAGIPPSPPSVDWRIEPGHCGAYRLRNTGSQTATGVRLQLPRSFNGQVHADFRDGSVLPGEAIDMRWYQNWKDLALNELPVLWDGQATPVLVPVPVPRA